LQRLFAFGLGYSARVLADRLARDGWQVAGTVRCPRNLEELCDQGYDVTHLSNEAGGVEQPPRLKGTTHILHSIPPCAAGDQSLARYRQEIAALSSLQWIGYLSTVGVYGNLEGEWADEGTSPQANTVAMLARLAAEQGWLEFGEETGVAVHVFRLAGIYGPGRCVFDRLRNGTAQRVKKDGQVFSRVHVEDVASVLEASMRRPRAGAIYNVADDEPVAPDEVVTYAADLLGVPMPPEIPFDQAELAPSAKSFYDGSSRIRNDRIKSELGVTLTYPTFREGLAALVPQSPVDTRESPRIVKRTGADGSKGISPIGAIA
jgi:hypothetical protein